MYTCSCDTAFHPLQVFGAFCSVDWAERKCKDKVGLYFGTGESFIFTLAPRKHKFAWAGLESEEHVKSRSANLFFAGEATRLLIGGG